MNADKKHNIYNQQLIYELIHTFWSYQTKALVPPNGQRDRLHSLSYCI